MTITRTTASPAKLRDGSWGARVSDVTVREGDEITITTRSGKSWDATVASVVWSGEGVSICSTESRDRTPSARSAAPRSRRTGCSCGSRETASGELVASARNCDSCEHDA